MARVTVEDCIEVVPNRFSLVALAAQRVRQFGVGAPYTIEQDNDKNTVIALRELADKTIVPVDLESALVKTYRRMHESEGLEQEYLQMTSFQAPDEEAMRDLAAELEEDMLSVVDEEELEESFNMDQEELSNADELDEEE